MSITYRPGTENDTYAVFQVFLKSIMDLSERQGVVSITGGDKPEVIANLWERRKSLFDHMAKTAERFWVAELEGEIIGYARSILRDGHRELTEFFVVPGQQSQGVGRSLLKEVFPIDGAAHRTIVASSDTRAQALYMKYKVYPRFPLMYFFRAPEKIEYHSDLEFQAMQTAEDTLRTVSEIDMKLLGFRRDIDHTWLRTERQGYIYLRQGQPVGYGYVGYRSGPFALFEAADTPAVLAHAEGLLVGVEEEFGVEVPLVNHTAVDYLLGRRFELASFTATLMCDKPFGKFESYICTSPPFFI